MISIHALREEGDKYSEGKSTMGKNFYPRPPRGGRPPELGGGIQDFTISIHALREEGDDGDHRCVNTAILFLSTPSARRATGGQKNGRPRRADFYPRPPRGGRQMIFFPVVWSFRNFYPRPPRGGRPAVAVSVTSIFLFLSTPSARRATIIFSRVFGNGGISIHALREEGDCGTPDIGSHGPYFYPRPPRGGRPLFGFGGVTVRRFLSTPSARRATAKTETKSLFSNKLYNILHEFRRALIYNGSKSYPNHAK